MKIGNTPKAKGLSERMAVLLPSPISDTDFEQFKLNR